VIRLSISGYTKWQPQQKQLQLLSWASEGDLGFHCVWHPSSYIWIKLYSLVLASNSLPPIPLLHPPAHKTWCSHTRCVSLVLMASVSINLLLLAVLFLHLPPSPHWHLHLFLILTSFRCWTGIKDLYLVSHAVFVSSFVSHVCTSPVILCCYMYHKQHLIFTGKI